MNIVGADTGYSNGYAKADGTSDATAYVSATAALIRAKYPDLTAGQVINRMIKSATFLTHGVKKVPDEKYGYGIIRPYAALTRNIPKGPTQGPLAQASPSTAASTDAGNDSTNQAKEKKGSSSMGAIVLLVGVIGLGAVIAVVVFAVTRSRRNLVNRSPISGPYPQNMGYPPQQAMPSTTQPPYSSPVANQPYGYPSPPAQPPQHPNPYTQQPPYGQ